jgi:GT2 family glycosyltransferase
VYIVPESHPLQLSIIIVSYNVRYFLEQCLCSVRKAIRNLEAEIIVIDNHSSDGSIEYLVPLFPEVVFLHNHQNLGFARANNQALEICRGEHILFLNPDTLIPEDCLEKCLDCIQEHPKTGALGVRMLDGRGRFLPESKRSFPSPLASLFKLAGLSGVFPRSNFFNRYGLGELNPETDHEVEVLAGAFLFSKKSILKELGGFDERFFLYGEDIDLSYRIQKSGWINRYFAGTEIIHFKGESAGRSQMHHVKFFYNAMLAFVQKHYSKGKARWYSFFLQAAVIGRAIISFAGRLVKPVLLLLTDAALLWSALQLVSLAWIYTVRNGVDFHVPSMRYTLPLLAIVFVMAAACIGLYQRSFKISRVFPASAFAVLSMLAVYSLLPETIRFSRGVIVWSGVSGSAFVLFFRLSLFRKMYDWMGYEWAGPGQVLVVGGKESAEAGSLLANRLSEEQISWIFPPEKKDNMADYAIVFRQLPVIRELVLCEGTMSVADIIHHVKQLKNSNMRLLFHMSGSHSIVGSDFPGFPGRSMSAFLYYQINLPYQCRMKRVIDILVSLLLILVAPLYMPLYKKGRRLFMNATLVLRGKYTWVGYIHPTEDLPSLRPGRIPHSGPLPLVFGEPAARLDVLYAKNYDWWQDLVIISRNYKGLAR